jgi:hypothetical protein
MKTRLQSLTSVVRDQVETYQRLTWFAIESLEREYLITLKAYWATLGVPVADGRSMPRSRPDSISPRGNRMPHFSPALMNRSDARRLPDVRPSR